MKPMFWKHFPSKAQNVGLLICESNLRKWVITSHGCALLVPNVMEKPVLFWVFSFLEMWQSTSDLTLSGCCNFASGCSFIYKKKKKRIVQCHTYTSLKYWLLSFSQLYDKPFCDQQKNCIFEFSKYICNVKIHTSLCDGQSKMQCSCMLASAGSVKTKCPSPPPVEYSYFPPYVSYDCQASLPKFQLYRFSAVYSEQYSPLCCT